MAASVLDATVRIFRLGEQPEDSTQDRCTGGHDDRFVQYNGFVTQWPIIVNYGHARV
jgi:hypothetical protein